MPLLGVLVAMTIALTGCTTPNPKIWGNATIWTYDDAAEVAKGSDQHKRIVESFGIYQDKELSEYVTAIGGKLAAVSERPALKWQFTVLDSATPRAFATRGGYVYITRGMLAMFRSESDLAAVLGHEIAHICTRDALRAERNGEMIGLGNLAAVIVTAPAALLFPYVSLAPAGAGMAALNRHDELNADQHGSEYLRRAGYPPEGMSAALEMLASMEAYERDRRKSVGRDTSGWWHRVFASHPSTDKRQSKLAHSGDSPKATWEPEFLARLDGLEFGSAKQEGIPSGRKRYFSQWNLLLEVPDGWTARLNERPAKLWLSRKDRKAYMYLEQVTTDKPDKLCETLASFAARESLTDLQRIQERDLQSCTGLVRRSTKTLFGRHESAFRIGIVTTGEAPGNGYVFRGHGYGASFSENDAIFLSIARSIEPPGETEKQLRPTALRIRYVNEGDSFASLAKTARGIAKPEDVLRSLNQRYPNGEPETGQLIKVIE
jgi:predicted Zn-dependent protease